MPGLMLYVLEGIMEAGVNDFILAADKWKNRKITWKQTTRTTKSSAA